MDITSGITQPTHSKNELFSKLEQPNTWGDLRMIIGISGFYRNFLPLYDLDIQPYINILSKNPQLGKLSQKEEM